MAKICSFEGCENAVHGLGYCSTHYAQFKKNQELKPIKAWMKTKCSVEKCTQPHLAKGFCAKHYRSEILGKQVCSVRECKNKVHSKGFCFTHYTQQSGKKCSISGCDRPLHGNGLCKNHLDMQKRKTNPEFAEKQRQKGRRWYRNHPEYHRNYWKQNKEKMTAQRMERHDEILEYLKKYNKKHQKEHNQDSKERYQKNKLSCLDFYSSGKIKCKRCEENEIAFMTIDHIKPRKEHGHSRKTSSSTLYRILVRDGFPSGFQVLCYNCNMIKEFERRKKDHVYSTNKATIREVRYGRKLKKDVMEVYSKGNAKCQCCGFDNIDGLSIDHIKPRKEHGHSRSFGSKHLYKFLKREKFPIGYQVLCINCNSAKGKLGKCPHQSKKA